MNMEGDADSVRLRSPVAFSYCKLVSTLKARASSAAPRRAAELPAPSLSFSFPVIHRLLVRHEERLFRILNSTERPSGIFSVALVGTGRWSFPDEVLVEILDSRSIISRI